MDVNNSVTDPRFAYELAWSLNQMFIGNNLQQVVNSLGFQFGEQMTGQAWPINDLVPPMCIVKGPSIVIVLVQGIRTGTQVGTLVLSWIEDRTNREHTGFVRSADRVSDTIYGRLAAFDCLAHNRIVLSGHSYGGMCLMSLANRLASERQARVVSLATFGSPKGGDDRMAVSMQRIDYGRYMNDGDNITFCPPIGDQAPLMHLLLTRHESLSINQLVLVGQGQVLSDTGAIAAAGYPPLPGIFTDLSIANFLISNSAPVALAHRIGEYERRLALWVDANPPAPARQRAAENQVGQAEPVQVPPAPPVDVWAGAEGNGLRRGGMLPVNEIPDRGQLAGVAGEPLNPVAQLGPVVTGPVGAAPTVAYRTRKIGRTWVVFYIEPDRIVMIARNKRAAKAFASKMNSALNGWDRAAATDEGGFEQSVIDAFN